MLLYETQILDFWLESERLVYKAGEGSPVSFKLEGYRTPLLTMNGAPSTALWPTASSQCLPFLGAFSELIDICR